MVIYQIHRCRQLSLYCKKKDRDKRFIKTWRPISLLNVDAKIGSKSLARRMYMCKVLPNIIHPDQCAYVKDRLISDTIRTIDDVMWYTRSRGIEGMLVAIDFEKAFDSVDLKSALRTKKVHVAFPSTFPVKSICGRLRKKKVRTRIGRSEILTNRLDSTRFDSNRLCCRRFDSPKVDLRET